MNSTEDFGGGGILLGKILFIDTIAAEFSAKITLSDLCF